MHIHFAHGAIPKDGPSAGVAIIASILSAALGKVIGKEKPYDVAYTGEVDLYGNVFAVGCIAENWWRQKSLVKGIHSATEL